MMALMWDGLKLGAHQDGVGVLLPQGKDRASDPEGGRISKGAPLQAFYPCTLDQSNILEAAAHGALGQNRRHPAHWPSRSAVRVEVSAGMAVLSFNVFCAIVEGDSAAGRSCSLPTGGTLPVSYYSPLWKV